MWSAAIILLSASLGVSPITNGYNPDETPPKLATESIVLYEPSAEWTYSHHPSLTFFKDRYYAMWSNGREDEDAPGQRVLIASSADFVHWTPPRPLVGPLQGKHSELVLTAAGFHQHDGTLVAYFGRYEYSEQHLANGRRKQGDRAHEDTGLMAMTSTDGEQWSAPIDLGVPIVPNHPPQATASGRLILCGNISFPYTDDPSGLKGWTMAGIYPNEMKDEVYDDSEGFWKVKERTGWPVGLCEGSFYQTGDGVLHMLLRSGTERLWGIESRDDGATWSTPAPTEFTDNAAKFHFGRLPDGRFYCVGNPDPEPRGRRNPLVLSVSEDGVHFGGHFVLADEAKEMKKPGLYKGGVYAYPHTLVHDGFLHVIVSVCKESVMVLRVPVAALGSAAEDVPPLWCPGIAFPKAAETRPLDGVTFHVIQGRDPEKDGYNWLHGVALVWHTGRLYASFGRNTGAENKASEVAQGRMSEDAGATWGPVFTIDEGDGPGLAVSHGVFLSHNGALWAFHGAFYGNMENVHTRAYLLDESAGTWAQEGVIIQAGFWPTQEPQQLPDGNFIMAGMRVANGYGGTDDPAAIALSHGTDFTRWDLVVIPKPPEIEMWGESAVIVDGSEMLNIARFGEPVALVASSSDSGRTWTESRRGNMPLAASKPYAGTLSNGQRYLIGTTTADSGNRRAPLTIAVSRPGETTFRRIYRIRDAIHDGPGESGAYCSLAYPYAVEHEGKLYVGYSNDGGRGKNLNSAELAVIPVAALAAAFSRFARKAR